jgi:hypothetical protein
VLSLAEESLRWPSASSALEPMVGKLGSLLPQLLRVEADRFSQGSHDEDLRSRAQSRSIGEAAQTDANDIQGPLAEALARYAKRYSRELLLVERLPIQVKGFHAVFRTAVNGRLMIELVAQLVQTDRTSEVDAMLGGLEVRGGTTIIVGVDGIVRYAIAKPLPDFPGPPGEIGRRRLERQRHFVNTLDAFDVRFPYMTQQKLKTRMLKRMSIRALHEGH